MSSMDILTGFEMLAPSDEKVTCIAEHKQKGNFHILSKFLEILICLESCLPLEWHLAKFFHALYCVWLQFPGSLGVYCSYSVMMLRTIRNIFTSAANYSLSSNCIQTIFSDDFQQVWNGGA